MYRTQGCRSSRLLRRDDAAQRVTPRQNDAAMVHFRPEVAGRGKLLNRLPRDEGASAGRAPVGDGVGGEHGVAMGADAFHIE